MRASFRQLATVFGQAAAGVALARAFSRFGLGTAAARHTAELDDIRQSRQGDSDAYRRLIERHQAAVAKLLWRFTRDRTEHEELVQQTFVEAWLSLPGFRAEAPFAHWLSRIAVRVGYGCWRHRQRHKTAALDADVLDPAAPGCAADPADAQHAAETVHRLLAELPPRDRLVLTLRYLEQCDIAQTAHRLGWTQTRVKVQTHRAIAKLKRLTATMGIEWTV